MANGVSQQICKYLPESIHIRVGLSRASGWFGYDLHLALVPGERAKRGDLLLDHLRQVRGFKSELQTTHFRARQREQVVDEMLQPAYFRLDGLEVTTQIVG